MNKTRLFGALCAAVFSFITLPSQAALISVLGGQAYYDDQLDITWTAESNINGAMTWDAANTWAHTLTVAGVSGWRLPNIDRNNDGQRIIFCAFTAPPITQAECADNEYAHLFYYGAGTTLGDGITPVSPGPFTNVRPYIYWSSTERDNDHAYWVYQGGFSNGVPNLPSSYSPKSDLNYAWAVRDGNAGDIDADGDGFAQGVDNCTLVANPTQLDANGDGYGNICDADLNNSGLVTTADFGLLRSVLNQNAASGPAAAAADLNGSGTVTTADFAILRTRLNTAPGPSGLACAGTIPCP